MQRFTPLFRTLQLLDLLAQALFPSTALCSSTSPACKFPISIGSFPNTSSILVNLGATPSIGGRPYNPTPGQKNEESFKEEVDFGEQPCLSNF